MGAQREEDSNAEISDAELRRLRAIIRAVLRRAGDSFNSDATEDCEIEARLALWQSRARLARLPEGERQSYKDACVRNEASRYLRRENAQRAGAISFEEIRAEEGQVEELVDRSAADWADLIARHLCDVIDDTELAAAVGALPDRGKAVLNLRYFERLTEPEVAVRMRVTVTCVKVRHFRAIDRVRLLLGLQSRGGAEGALGCSTTDTGAIRPTQTEAPSLPARPKRPSDIASGSAARAEPPPGAAPAAEPKQQLRRVPVTTSASRPGSIPAGWGRR